MRIIHASLHMKVNQLGKQLNISANQRENIDNNNNNINNNPPFKGAVKRPFTCAGQQENKILSLEMKAFTS